MTNPVVARAAVSPTALAAGAGGAVIGFFTMPPAGVALGVATWAIGAGVSLLRRRQYRPGQAIDPYAVREPWRRHLHHAMRARRRFDELTADVPAGPLHDRLVDIGRELEDGVTACWAVARRGHLLDDARRSIDTVRVRHELDTVERGPAGDEPEIRARTRASLLAQLATADRLDATIRSSRDRLRLLDARLTEAVARAAEIAVAGRVADLEGVSLDIAGVADEMESLRAALEELNRPDWQPRPGPWPGHDRPLPPAPPTTPSEETPPGPALPYPPSEGYPPSTGYPPSEGYPPPQGWAADTDDHRPDPPPENDR